jgi:hypothetical protein
VEERASFSEMFANYLQDSTASYAKVNYISYLSPREHQVLLEDKYLVLHWTLVQCKLAQINQRLPFAVHHPKFAI